MSGSATTTVYKIDYLSVYQSDRYDLGFDVPDHAWQPTIHACETADQAQRLARRYARDEGVVYRVREEIKITKTIMIIDRDNTDISDI